jgi:epoxyqueuosine reductase
MSTTALSGQLQEHGYRGRMVDIGHLRDLQAQIEKQHNRGLISDDIYSVLKSALEFSIPDDMHEAHSLIIIAAPDPQVEIVFHHNGVPRRLPVPPTYLYYRDVNRKAQELLEEILGPGQCSLALARVPVKLLATSSGMASYGRNNISYVEGLGSYHRLVAFYSDYPCKEEIWGLPRPLAACETCSACLHTCPTGAISDDRFLIHAERCLSFMNEYPGAFPERVDASWHHCIVGCLLCQTVCPENRGMLHTIEADDKFSEAETESLLEGIPASQLPRALHEKLNRLGLLDYLDVLPRNLAALL